MLAHDVKSDVGCSTLQDLLERLPRTAQLLTTAREGLRQQGSPAAEGASLADALGAYNKQRVFISVAQKKKHTAHLRGLSTPEKPLFLGAGGPGASAFLHYPSDANCSMEDVLWSTALRQRLGIPDAGSSDLEHLTASTTCKLCTNRGAVCNKELDDHGYHSCTC